MDAIYLKLDGIEGESRIKGFENQIKLIAYNHNPTKRESGEARGTYIGGLTLTKPVDLATPGLYEHYCNGKTVKEGVLTLCRRDKGAMLPFIIYTLTNVRISRMSNHGDAEGSATETVDLVYSHIRWDIPALASKANTAASSPTGAVAMRTNSLRTRSGRCCIAKWHLAACEGR